MKNECKFLGIEEMDRAITGFSIGICGSILYFGEEDLHSGVIPWERI